ncbi:hypothetical protein OROGR_006372 [Orobanche gracilis]
MAAADEFSGRYNRYRYCTIGRKAAVSGRNPNSCREWRGIATGVRVASRSAIATAKVAIDYYDVELVGFDTSMDLYASDHFFGPILNLIVHDVYDDYSFIDGFLFRGVRLLSGKEEVDSHNSFQVEPVDLSRFFEDDGMIYGYQGLKLW